MLYSACSLSLDFWHTIIRKIPSQYSDNSVQYNCFSTLRKEDNKNIACNNFFKNIFITSIKIYIVLTFLVALFHTSPLYCFFIHCIIYLCMSFIISVLIYYNQIFIIIAYFFQKVYTYLIYKFLFWSKIGKPWKHLFSLGAEMTIWRRSLQKRWLTFLLQTIFKWAPATTMSQKDVISITEQQYRETGGNRWPTLIFWRGRCHV